MATGADVLTMLLPDGGWVLRGDNYEGIQFLDDAKPKCTKAQFEAGFAQYDVWKAAQDKAAADTKASAIAKLVAPTYIPLTADEAATIVI